MKLVEDGLIDLDTPLESYLPKKLYEYEPQTRWHDDFSDLREDSLYHKISARMCLTHTTGFANSRWQEDDHKLRVHGIPGTRYSYSGYSAYHPPFDKFVGLHTLLLQTCKLIN